MIYLEKGLSQLIMKQTITFKWFDLIRNLYIHNAYINLFCLDIYLYKLLMIIFIFINERMWPAEVTQGQNFLTGNLLGALSLNIQAKSSLGFLAYAESPLPLKTTGFSFYALLLLSYWIYIQSILSNLQYFTNV